jgi:hypothetical protein
VGCFRVAVFVEHFFGVAAMTGILVNYLGGFGSLTFLSFSEWGKWGYLVEKGCLGERKTHP